jgi:hypothetical protein
MGERPRIKDDGGLMSAARAGASKIVKHRTWMVNRVSKIDVRHLM